MLQITGTKSARTIAGKVKRIRELERELYSVKRQAAAAAAAASGTLRYTMLLTSQCYILTLQ
jgi:hypothetical protein